MRKTNTTHVQRSGPRSVVPWIIAVGLLATMAATASAGAGDAAVRSSSAAGIDIAVRLERINSVGEGESDTLEFRVSLDTHFADLFQFDLSQLSELSVDGGSRAEASFEWHGDSETSHHRTGTLIARIADDRSRVGPGDEIQPRIFEIGAEERIFTWQL